ncbi:helix-turn-helix domain-containing protein [Paenibacillus chartarius]|uniref:Helix-turn-helix domain-containing protein n=1 Tax=Paenibacillus chartarius TaxID=747481 RepID=A0ABV6DV27_9BACL
MSLSPLTRTIEYGSEEDGPFYLQHIRRPGPFERTQHMHEMFELYYLYEGQRLYFVRDRSYHVLPGDLVLIPQREAHSVSDYGKPGHERVVMNFSGAFLGGMLEEAPYLLDAYGLPSPIVRLDAGGRREAEELLGRMIREAEQDRLGREFALRGLLGELLLFIVRFARTHRVAAPEHVSPLHGKISDIVRYLNARYAEPVRLDELAEQFDISGPYLSRMFKEITGFSLIEYVQLMRVREAQRLLETTNEKVIAVAEHVGFGSLVQFGRVFRQLTKTTPLRYRQAAQGKRK